MADSQPIVQHPSAAAIFLVLVVSGGAQDSVRDTLSGVDDLRKAVGFRVPEADLTCVIGVGARLWDRMYGSPRPAKLHPMPAYEGARHAAPSTPGDLLVHIRCARVDLCFELAQRITEALGDSATVVDEVHGFKSFDERDLLGFVDGTANPDGEAADAAVFVSDEDPAFAGGAYVLVQKYRHDLTAWDAISVEDQEAAVGRTKLSNIEIPDEEKAPDSHVALNTIVDAEGVEHDVMRFNMPFGAVGAREFGTYYIAYARDIGVLEQMLSNMFCGTEDAAHDRLLDFSTAVTGCEFFAPTAEWLADPPSPSEASDPAPGADAPAAEPDDSLGIGGLR